MTVASGTDRRWIVCRGEVRTAIDGSVHCPVRDQPVTLGECATCRWLEDAEDDRFAAWTCGADAPTRLAAITCTHRTPSDR